MVYFRLIRGGDIQRQVENPGGGIQRFSKLDGLDHDINFQEVSSQLEGWSGRDIKEKLIKIAFHNAIISKIDTILTQDLIKIIQKVKKKEDTDNTLFS